MTVGELVAQLRAVEEKSALVCMPDGMDVVTLDYQPGTGVVFLCDAEEPDHTPCCGSAQGHE